MAAAAAHHLTVLDPMVVLYLMRQHTPARGDDVAQVPVSGPQMREQISEGHIMHPIPKTPFTVRYPLLVRGGIALILMGVTRLAVALGWIPQEWELTENGVEQLLDGAYFAWAWFAGQRKVTPVADPRDDRGRPLVMRADVEAQPMRIHTDPDDDAPVMGWPRPPR